MKNNILFRTNFFVCVIIVLGFIITSITSYRSNMGILEKDIEHVSDLAAEGIYYQIESIFTKPVNVSLTMANDSLLKEFLSNESHLLVEDDFLWQMREYLYTYRQKYGYDSVFLVSSKTRRYYHFNGLDRTLEPENPENTWYYDFLKNGEEYSLNIDNDEASGDEITVFINCKIKNRNGSVLGVVGVGFRVNKLQSLLQDYEKEFQVQSRLVDRNGTVQIATDHTGFENLNLFDGNRYGGLKDQLLTKQNEPKMFWHRFDSGKAYLVSRYISNLDWHLIVENDTGNLDQIIQESLTKGVLIIAACVALVLFTITAVMRRYNAQIVELTTAREREYSKIRQDAAKELYENIYELDITHNCAAGDSTERYFESLGVPAQTPYDKALRIIAAKQIKEEYQEGYISTFSPEHVLEAYDQGIKSLSYDFMISNNGQNYYWMRIVACIFFWSEDNSVRMTIYHQNINDEKQQQALLLARMQSDPLTGLYNKAATEEKISEIIVSASPNKQYAFFILDIDNFKQVNDTFGHACGDFVISQFAQKLKCMFRNSDTVGRIGGDEFAVFLPIPNQEWLVRKAQALVSGLNHSVMTTAGKCDISTSIGISVYPETGADFVTLYKNADLALYETKKRGKNGYTIYQP